MQFMCVLTQFSLKHERMLTISSCKHYPNYLRQFLKTRDWNELTSLLFTIVHQLEQGQV